MKDTIFYVGGEKGGVGKSTIAKTLVEWLADKCGETKTVHVIETDDTNPDVGRVYNGKIPVDTAILDESAKGWLHMAEILETSTNTLFVINSAARSGAGIRKNGENLVAVLESGELAYDFVTLWPMNRQKDSVTLLEDFLDHITYGAVYPIRNKYFGDPDEFTLYAQYLKKSKKLSSRITRTLDFPALADIIADDFHTSEKTIPEMAKKLSAFARQNFVSWQKKAYTMFEEMLAVVE